MTQDELGGPKDTGKTSVGITAARARVLDRLRSRVEPWGIPELAETLDLHRNTVREHLTALTEDGLAEYIEVRSPGPGRPARHYKATALGSGVDYLEMSIAMAQAVSDLPNSAEFVRRTGEAWGRRLSEQLTASHPNQGITGWMDELGFSASRIGENEIKLSSCPVLAAARQNPQVICGIHAEVVRALMRPESGEVNVDLFPWALPTGCLVRFSQVEAASLLRPQVAWQRDQ